MKKLNISNVKVKFNANPNSSRITFETSNGEPVVWVKTSDVEGFVTNSEAVTLASSDTSQFEHCYDGFDDIFGFENEWEECANRKLAKCHVSLETIMTMANIMICVLFEKRQLFCIPIVQKAKSGI